MASLKDMRQAIAESLTIIPGLQVSAYYLENVAPTPRAHVVPGNTAGPIIYDQTMSRGLDFWPFAVQVFVAVGLERAAQETLDKFMEPFGTFSVKAAVERSFNSAQARTLGGVVEDVAVESCSGLQPFPFAEVLLGAEWRVNVYARGDE